MLIFESSIFASFIPQILMLVSYLSCLLLPGLHKAEAKADIPLKQIEISIQEATPTAAVHFYSIDLQQQTIIVSDENPQIPVYVSATLSFPFTTHISTDYHSFQLFSRPPPPFC